jgi:hypothetical protein
VRSCDYAQAAQNRLLLLLAPSIFLAIRSDTQGQHVTTKDEGDDRFCPITGLLLDMSDDERDGESDAVSAA